jgi:hypothetical protein
VEDDPSSFPADEALRLLPSVLIDCCDEFDDALLDFRPSLLKKPLLALLIRSIAPPPIELPPLFFEDRPIR